MDTKLHLGASVVKISIKVLDILPSKLMHHHLRLQIGVQLLSVSDGYKVSQKHFSNALSLMIWRDRYIIEDSKISSERAQDKSATGTEFDGAYEYTASLSSYSPSGS